MSGRLVWTPAERSPDTPSAFGDAPSAYYKPTGGEITVEIESSAQALGGPARCETRGKKAFPVADLPAEALRYLWLEVADDGRYRISLGLSDRIWRIWRMQAESVCAFPMGKVVRDSLPVNQVALMLGEQDGRLSDQEAVTGRLPAPIRNGVRTINGGWSFNRQLD